MRVLVVGAGGVGGYFGAKLARAGTGVAMLARGAHLDAIRRDGLRVRSTIEGESVAHVEASDRVETAAVDAVLLCVKSYDTESALEAIRPAVGPDTAVLSLQNGVDNEDKIDAVLGPGHALGGAAYVFATIEAPGVIAHRFAGRIVFGEMDGRPRPRARRLHDAFAAAGVEVELSTDVRRALWEKYLLISAQAGMTCITRCPTRVVRETPETWAMYRRIVEELSAVGRAAGVALAPDVVESIMKQAAAIGGDTYSSLHHDLVAGKRLELDALHGHAVRLGERLGVPVPTIFAVYAALKPYVDGRRG
jgi:2-dehydropantoate 2-reductase